MDRQALSGLRAAGVVMVALLAGPSLGVGPFAVHASDTSGASGAPLPAGPSGPSARSAPTAGAAVPLAGPALEVSDQTLQTTAVPGTITVTGAVSAASGRFLDGAAGLAGAARLSVLLVTDGRPAPSGYVVTGVVPATPDGVDAAVVGWAPVVAAPCGRGQVPFAPTFTDAGPATAGTACTQVPVSPGPPVVPGRDDGLATPRTLFRTFAGSSAGTAVASADLLVRTVRQRSTAGSATSGGLLVLTALPA